MNHYLNAFYVAVPWRHKLCAYKKRSIHYHKLCLWFSYWWIWCVRVSNANFYSELKECWGGLGLGVFLSLFLLNGYKYETPLPWVVEYSKMSLVQLLFQIHKVRKCWVHIWAFLLFETIWYCVLLIGNIRHRK